jgi:hypothetical protein
MTIFIEPFRRPHEHMMVVQSFLLLESNRNNNIYLIATNDYFNSIPVHCTTNVKFIEIKNLYSSSLLRVLSIFFLVINFSWKFKPERIILLSTKSYSSLLIKLWTMISCNRQKIYILLHGELQYLINSDSLSQKLDVFINKFNFYLSHYFNSNVKFVILSELVYENFCIQIGFRLRNIIHLDLPYDYTRLFYNSLPERECNKLILSTIGVNARNKNSHYLNILADYLVNEMENSLVELKCIGRVHDVEFKDSIVLLNLDGSYFVDPDLYSKLILESTFILSFVDDKNYSLISSGSYFDCIKYQIPILAIRNSQWSYNFQKFGEIGVLFNSVDEMLEYIRSMINRPDEAFKFDSNLKEAMSLSSITNNLENYNSLFV